MIRLGQGAVTSLALRLCRKVLGLPLEEFEALDPGGPHGHPDRKTS